MLRFWLWWQARSRQEIQNIEDMRHEIRNAMAGIEYHRRMWLKAISQQSKSYLAMNEHMERIERALECHPENTTAS